MGHSIEWIQSGSTWNTQPWSVVITSSLATRFCSNPTFPIPQLEDELGTATTTHQRKLLSSLESFVLFSHPEWNDFFRNSFWASKYSRSVSFLHIQIYFWPWMSAFCAGYWLGCVYLSSLPTCCLCKYCVLQNSWSFGNFFLFSVCTLSACYWVRDNLTKQH
jgi:hypothetical protein